MNMFGICLYIFNQHKDRKSNEIHEFTAHEQHLYVRTTSELNPDPNCRRRRLDKRRLYWDHWHFRTYIHLIHVN